MTNKEARLKAELFDQLLAIAKKATRKDISMSDLEREVARIEAELTPKEE